MLNLLQVLFRSMPVALLVLLKDSCNLADQRERDRLSRSLCSR